MTSNRKHNFFNFTFPFYTPQNDQRCRITRDRKSNKNHKSKKENLSVIFSSSGVQGHRKFITQRRQTSTRIKTKECSRTIHESSLQ